METGVLVATALLPSLFALALIIAWRAGFSMRTSVGLWAFAWLAIPALAVMHYDSWALAAALPGACFAFTSLFLSSLFDHPLKALLAADIEYQKRHPVMDIETLVVAVQGISALRLLEGTDADDDILDLSASDQQQEGSRPQRTSGPYTLTRKHMDAYAELKGRVTDIPLLEVDPNAFSESEVLHRYLLCKHSVVADAEATLRRATEWRRREKPHLLMHTIAKAYSGGFQGFFKCALYGVDVDGFPVYWQCPEPKNIEKLIKTHGNAAAVKLNLYLAERCRECAKSVGAERFTVVLNLKSVTAGSLFGSSMDMLKDQMKSSAETYPECMWRCIVYNPPWVFETAYGIVKTFLEERVQAKVVVGNDHLAKFVTPLNTPREFGGKAPVSWDDIAIPAMVGPLPPLKANPPVPSTPAGHLVEMMASLGGASSRRGRSAEGSRSSRGASRGSSAPR